MCSNLGWKICILMILPICRLFEDNSQMIPSHASESQGSYSPGIRNMIKV